MLNILFFCSFAALVAGSLPLWLNAAKRTWAGGSVLESRERDGTPFGFMDVIVVFFIWLFGQVASLGVAAVLLDMDLGVVAAGEKQVWQALIVNFGQLVAIFAAMGVLFLRYKRVSIFGWQPENLRRDVLLTVLAFVMVIPAILTVQWLLTFFLDYKHSTLEMLVQNANAQTVFAAWFGAVLVAPICEEIFFRGILQAWLQRWSPGVLSKGDYILLGGWDSDYAATAHGGGKPIQIQDPDQATTESNPYATPKPESPAQSDRLGFSRTSDSYWPIVVTAALFGLAHAGQGPAPISLFIFGVALGYLYQRTGSIVLCILLHMALNGFSMFWFTLKVMLG